jgi:hypothetical protein
LDDKIPFYSVFKKKGFFSGEKGLKSFEFGPILVTVDSWQVSVRKLSYYFTAADFFVKTGWQGLGKTFFSVFFV